jgi:hypothetical protein
VHRVLSVVLITSLFAVARLVGQSSTSIVGTWKVVKYEDREAVCGLTIRGPIKCAHFESRATG